MIPRLRSEREDLIQQAVAEGAGICLLPSAIVDGLTLRPVETLNLSRTIAFQSISIGNGSGPAAASRADQTFCVVVILWGADAYGASQAIARLKQNPRVSW
jgi:DNA-binding transcriptional LysR family regulator